jgi:anti-anti-sigma factor
MDLVVQTIIKNDTTIFRMSGDLNYDGILYLKQVFEDAISRGALRFILDMENLRTISSYALSIILRLNDAVKDRAGSFKIICPAGNVSDVFNVLDIAAVIPLYSSEEELWKNDVQ